MKETKLKFGVVGSGSWATALIKILSENNNDINWYIRNSENIEFIVIVSARIYKIVLHYVPNH